MSKQQLTDLLLRKTKVKISGQRIEFSDLVCSGLFVRITVKSTKFGFRYRLEGRDYRDQLGEYPECSLKQARDQAGRLRIQIKDGYNPIAKKKKQEIQQCKELMQQTSLKDVAKKFKVHHLPQLAANTQKAYLRELENHIIPLLGRVAIVELGIMH